MGIAVIATVLFAALGVWPAVVVGVVVFAIAAIAWWWQARLVASWRYCEREDDLLVSRGRFYRQLTIVPYGRMQVIDVEAGPLANRYGIAKVELVTASASTDAAIPGLPTQVAYDLRNRLAAKGEAAAAGL